MPANKFAAKEFGNSSPSMARLQRGYAAEADGPYLRKRTDWGSLTTVKLPSEVSVKKAVA